MINGAIEGWNAGGTSSLVPQTGQPYGDRAVRCLRYNVARQYYNSEIYDDLSAYSALLKEREGLYQFIRPIENVVRQLVELNVAYTYRGTVDTQNLRTGALPLLFDNKALEEPLKQVIKWSSLDTHIGNYVRDAALDGDAAWWIVDDPFRQRVRMEQIDPARVKFVERDEVGNVKACVLEYECEEQPDVERYQPSRWGSGLSLQRTKVFTKTIKVTKEWFETFKDGEPFPFYMDESGKPVDRWPNIYGFVPLKLAMYRHGKDGWGQNSFFGPARRAIDELNDQVSIINDTVRNVVMPSLKVINMRAGTNVQVERNVRDSMSLLYVNGDNADIAPLVVPVDLAAASAHFQAQRSSLRKLLPILALADIRDIGGNLSGIAIANMFGDAIADIENNRKNLNPAIIGALQMAMSMAGIRGYEGLKGITAQTFDNGDMELSIKETSVIDDKLSRSDEVDKIVSIASLPAGSKRKAFEVMGYSDDDIEEIVSEDEAAKQEAQAQFQQNATPQLPPGQGAPQLPAGDKVGANGMHPAANGQKFADLTATWSKLGIAPSLMGGSKVA